VGGVKYEIRTPGACKHRLAHPASQADLPVGQHSGFCSCPNIRAFTGRVGDRCLNEREIKRRTAVIVQPQASRARAGSAPTPDAGQHANTAARSGERSDTISWGPQGRRARTITIRHARRREPPPSRCAARCSSPITKQHCPRVTAVAGKAATRSNCRLGQIVTADEIAGRKRGRASSCAKSWRPV